jgi:hypothetical protein
MNKQEVKHDVHVQIEKSPSSFAVERSLKLLASWQLFCFQEIFNFSIILK